MSLRSLASATKEIDEPAGGTGLSRAQLHRLEAGTEAPSPRAMRLIAAGLDEEPTYFAEYELAEFRAKFDERDGGLGAAYAAMRAYESRDAATKTSPAPRVGRRRPRRLAA